MAISSTVVAKLGGNVEYVALDGGGNQNFSVNLPAGTWLIQCGFASDTLNKIAKPTIKGTNVGAGPGGLATCIVAGGGRQLLRRHQHRLVHGDRDQALLAGVV